MSTILQENCNLAISFMHNTESKSAYPKLVPVVNFHYGAFTLMEANTETDTNIEKIGKVPNGDQCLCQSQCTMNNSA